jgi:hypothetical protein
MLNRYYCENHKNLKEIKQVLDTQEVVSLFDFLEKKEFEQIQKNIQKLPFKYEKNPLTHSYSKAVIPIGLFSNEVLRILSVLTNKEIINITAMTAYKFKHHDYTLLHDTLQQKSDIEIIFNISKWDSKCGGSVLYIDGSGDFIQVPCNANALTIIRTKGRKQFVKYINCKAKKSERIFLQTILL